MKKMILILIGLTVTMTTNAQEEEMSKKMPPMSMLPKDGEMKRMYELPDSSDYKIYNQKGKLVESGQAEFIDITDYKKGTYFIVYDGKKEMFICEKKTR